MPRSARRGRDPSCISQRRPERSAWEEFTAFLDYDVEIRKIICSALKCLYLVTRSLGPTGRGKTRRVMRWRPALNAFAITFEGRIVASTAN